MCVHICVPTDRHVCMHVNLYMCICAHASQQFLIASWQLHAHVHNHVCVCAYVCLYMCECVHLWCLCVYVSYICECTYVSLYICVCVYVYVCIFAVQYLLTFHSSLPYYNSICWCWTASRNVYFELTEEDFCPSVRTHLYICTYLYILYFWNIEVS